jgi:hypothetical protein
VNKPSQALSVNAIRTRAVVIIIIRYSKMESNVDGVRVCVSTRSCARKQAGDQTIQPGPGQPSPAVPQRLGKLELAGVVPGEWSEARLLMEKVSGTTRAEGQQGLC